MELLLVLNVNLKTIYDIIVGVYCSNTGPVELEQDNQSDAFTGHLYLSVASVVWAWVPRRESKMYLSQCDQP